MAMTPDQWQWLFGQMGMPATPAGGATPSGGGGRIQNPFGGGSILSEPGIPNIPYSDPSTQPAPFDPRVVPWPMVPNQQFYGPPGAYLSPGMEPPYSMPNFASASPADYFRQAAAGQNLSMGGVRYDPGEPAPGGMGDEPLPTGGATSQLPPGLEFTAAMPEPGVLEPLDLPPPSEPSSPYTYGAGEPSVPTYPSYYDYTGLYPNVPLQDISYPAGGGDFQSPAAPGGGGTNLWGNYPLQMPFGFGQDIGGFPGTQFGFGQTPTEGEVAYEEPPLPTGAEIPPPEGITDLVPPPGIPDVPAYAQNTPGAPIAGIAQPTFPITWGSPMGGVGPLYAPPGAGQPGLLDRAGQGVNDFLGGVGDFLSNAFNPSTGYYSPQYLSSIGYLPGGGVGSLWPGLGPGSLNAPGGIPIGTFGQMGGTMGNLGGIVGLHTANWNNTGGTLAQWLESQGISPSAFLAGAYSGGGVAGEGQPNTQRGTGGSPR